MSASHERTDSPDLAARVSAPRALGEALAQERAYLVRHARRWLADPALVEDVVQETLLSAWRDAGHFAQRSAARTWLTSILRRRVADALRERRRHSAVFAAIDADALGADDASVDPDRRSGHATAGFDPQRQLESRQALAEVIAQIGGLPGRAAQLIELRALGASNDEAAQALGLSPGQSALLAHRVRSRLRRGAQPERRSAGATERAHRHVN